ncbi:MAG: DUF922 domain-containing protein [Bacteroidales bacterium]|jgi:hypothetical protein
MKSISRYSLNTSVVLFLFLLFTGFGPDLSLEGKSENSEQTIQWNEQRKLDWRDFKATKKPTGKVAAAISTCGFGFEATEENHRLVGLKIYVKFYPEKSWKNPAHQTEAVLAHEQIHFNITELMGRRLYQEILEMKRKGKLNQRNIKKSYDRLEKEHGEMQNLYDKQTRHGLNTKLQSWWAGYISSELEKTTAFSEYHELKMD